MMGFRVGYSHLHWFALVGRDMELTKINKTPWSNRCDQGDVVRILNDFVNLYGLYEILSCLILHYEMRC